MTLTITIVSRNVLVQSGDFRKSFYGHGWRDFDTQKHLLIEKSRWFGSVAFSGIGHTGHVDVAEWSAAAIQALPQDASPAECCASLERFAGELRRMPSAFDKRHTFSVIGFEGTRPFIALVSNFEALDALPTRTADRSLRTTMSRSRRLRVELGGSGRALIPRIELRLLARLLQRNANDDRIMEAVAGINARVARDVADESVSPACFVSVLRADGRCRSRPYGVALDQTFIPKSVKRLLDQVDFEYESEDELGTRSSFLVIDTSSRIPLAGPRQGNDAIELNPHHSEAPDERAAYLQNYAFDFDGLDYAYRRTLELEPDNEASRLDYARFLTTVRDDAPRAIAVLRAGLDLNGASPALRVELERLES